MCQGITTCFLLGYVKCAGVRQQSCKTILSKNWMKNVTARETATAIFFILKNVWPS